MLIICEDCARRYNIDESRIKGNRARFTCKECGHIIIVEKSDLDRPLISAASSPSEVQAGPGTIDLLREMEVAADPPSSNAGAEGIPGDTDQAGLKGSHPFFIYFLPVLLVSLLGTAGVLVYLYFGFIADSLAGSGTRGSFLATALLLVGLSWIVSLAVYFILVRLAARSVLRLKDEVLGLARGGGNIEPGNAGPREVRELAAVLAGLLRSRGY
jgi:predicted Zn finger-like uncharacterized protein